MNYLKKVIYERYRTHFLKIESVAAFSLLECSDRNNPSADHKVINRIIEDIKIKAKNLLIYHSDVDLSAIFEVLTLEDIQKLNLFLQIDDLDKGFKDKILAFMRKKEISK